MSENPILHPFEMKRDARGKFIPPDFVDAPIEGPTVPTVNQVLSGTLLEQETVMDSESPEENLESPQNVEQAGIQEATESAPVETRSRDKAPAAPKEHNLRRLREELERERSEKDLMARELEMLRRVGGTTHSDRTTRADRAQVPVDEVEIPDIEIGDDDLVEGKHLKQYVQQMQRQMNATKQQYAQQAATAYNASLEVQIKSQYPDFDQVVSQANLKDLAALYPELAATLNTSPDLRTQAVSAYTMIKNLGIDQDQGDPYMADKEKIKKNAAKPRPSNSVTPTHGSPLAQAGAFSGELTPALRKQLQTEMEQFRRR
jgi:hypothetical protein